MFCFVFKQHAFKHVRTITITTTDTADLESTTRAPTVDANTIARAHLHTMCMARNRPSTSSFLLLTCHSMRYFPLMFEFAFVI